MKNSKQKKLKRNKQLNMAYSNNYSQSTDFTTNNAGQGYSLMTAGGTEPIIGSLLGAGMGTSNTLGG